MINAEFGRWKVAKLTYFPGRKERIIFKTTCFHIEEESEYDDSELIFPLIDKEGQSIALKKSVELDMLCIYSNEFEHLYFLKQFQVLSDDYSLVKLNNSSYIMKKEDQKKVIRFLHRAAIQGPEFYTQDDIKNEMEIHGATFISTLFDKHKAYGELFERQGRSLRLNVFK